MTEHLPFPESYDAVEVPETMRSMDAIDERVAEAGEKFFGEIIDSLQFPRLALESFCRIRHRMLVPTIGHSLARGGLRESDDSISELWVEGVQPLATVLKTRDERNWQVASFAKYPLLPQTIQIVNEIDTIANIVEPITGQ